MFGFPALVFRRLIWPQLTHNGFGYAATGGNYANPFFADFLSPARYLDFFSAPPFTSELPISFSATLTAVPEPEIYALLFLGLGILSRSRCRKKCRSGVADRQQSRQTDAALLA